MQALLTHLFSVNARHLPIVYGISANRVRRCHSVTFGLSGCGALRHASMRIVSSAQIDGLNGVT